MVSGLLEPGAKSENSTELQESGNLGFSSFSYRSAVMTGAKMAPWQGGTSVTSFSSLPVWQ